MYLQKSIPKTKNIFIFLLYFCLKGIIILIKKEGEL